MENYLPLILISALPLVLVAYSIVILVLCWLNPGLTVIKKILWTVFILLTGLVTQIGPIIYGFIHLKNVRKIFPLLAVMAVVGYHYYVWAHRGEFSAMAVNISMEGAEKAISASPDSPDRQQALKDIATLKQELASHNLTKEQESTYAQLGIYLGLLSINGLHDEDYQEWQALFAQRATLKPEYVGKLIESKAALLRSAKR